MLSFDLDGFSRFIAEMRTALELPSLTLVGHSMGGSISMYYAGRYPDKVKHLVLIDAPANAKALSWQSRLPGAGATPK